ncbi:MAG: DUF5915 domain-containing protein, partial [Actinomycetota bacterium]
SKLLAPFAPFLADALYRNLVVSVNPDAPESVHLTDWPVGDPQQVDARLAAGMAAVRELASLGHSARGEANVKIRQPLGHAVLLAPEDLQDAIEELADILADEMNVDDMSFAEDAENLVKTRLRPNYRTAGPDLGPKVRAFASYLEGLDEQTVVQVAETLEEGVEVDIELPGGETIRVGGEHIEIRREPAEGTAFAYEPPFGVSLSLEITPELKRQGLVREFVHAAQLIRREFSLEVTDRIALDIAGPADALEALRSHEDYVTEELLAEKVSFSESLGELADCRTISVEGAELRVRITKVS